VNRGCCQYSSHPKLSIPSLNTHNIARSNTFKNESRRNMNMCNKTTHSNDIRGAGKLHLVAIEALPWRNMDFLMQKLPTCFVRLAEKPPVAKLFKNFPFYGIPTVYYRVDKSPSLVIILSQMNLVRTTHPISLILILIFSHLRLGLASRLFPSSAPTKTLFLHACYMPSRLIFLELMILMTGKRWTRETWLAVHC
jgi:hypothetical protein